MSSKIAVAMQNWGGVGGCGVGANESAQILPGSCEWSVIPIGTLLRPRVAITLSLTGRLRRYSAALRHGVLELAHVHSILVILSSRTLEPLCRAVVRTRRMSATCCAALKQNKARCDDRVCHTLRGENGTCPDP